MILCDRYSTFKVSDNLLMDKISAQQTSSWTLTSSSMKRLALERLRVCSSVVFVVLFQGDDDLLTVYIGEIFLEFVNMLPAFQTYCLQQSASVNLLNTLEKEKELLRYGLCSSSWPAGWRSVLLLLLLRVILYEKTGSYHLFRGRSIFGVELQ